MAQQNLEDLIVRHFGGELSADEQRQLAKALDESSEARKLMASYMRLEGAAIQIAKAGMETIGQTASEKREQAQNIDGANLIESKRFALNSPPIKNRILWIAIASICLVGLSFLIYKLAEPSPSLKSSVNQATPKVASLVRAVDVEWIRSEISTKVGTRLPAGRLALSSGLVEIQFDSGASVILEGPAEFDLVSADRGFLQRGKLRGVVPPGSEGFTVGSAELTVVDLGTEFGFQVDETGGAEVHVFDGEVEIHDSSNLIEFEKGRILTAGNGVRIDDSGTEVDIEADETSFVSTAMFAVVADAYVNELQQQYDKLQQRESVLSNQITENIRQLDQSDEIVRMAERRLNAERALSAYLSKHPEVKEAEKKIEDSQSELEKITRKKIDQSFEGAKLRNEVLQAH